MKNVYRCIFVTGFAIYATGCSTSFSKYNPIQIRQTEYQQSQTVAPIKIPAGMSSMNLHEAYAIPSANAPASNKSPSLLPPDSIAQQIKDGKLSPNALREREAEADSAAATNTAAMQTYNITSVKNDTLIINQPISNAWLQVGDAINKAGYKIAIQNQSALTYYILDVYMTKGNVTRATPIYQIHLRNTPLGVKTYVTDNRGVRANITDANRILDGIYKFLPKQIVRPTDTNTYPAATPNSAPAASPYVPPTTNFGRLINSIFK